MLSTTPQINNTEIETNITQKLQHLQFSVVKQFGIGLSEVYNHQDMKGVPNVTFSKIAKLEKFIKDIVWPINITSVYETIELTPRSFEVLITDYAKHFSLYTYKDVVFTLKNTVNGYCQGLTLVAYDPSPHKDYYKTMFGITPADYGWMLDHFKFEPNTADIQSFSVPWNYPFRYLPGEEFGDGRPENYMKDYSLGRFIFIPLSPLATTQKSITSLTYSLRGRINDLQVLGTFYKKP